VSTEKEEETGIEQAFRTVRGVFSGETDETLVQRETRVGEQQGERATTGGGRDGDRGSGPRGNEGETGEKGEGFRVPGEGFALRVRRQRDVIPAFGFFFSHKRGRGSNDPIEVRLDAVPQRGIPAAFLHETLRDDSAAQTLPAHHEDGVFAGFDLRGFRSGGVREGLNRVAPRVLPGSEGPEDRGGGIYSDRGFAHDAARSSAEGIAREIAVGDGTPGEGDGRRGTLARSPVGSGDESADEERSGVTEVGDGEDGEHEARGFRDSLSGEATESPAGPFERGDFVRGAAPCEERSVGFERVETREEGMLGLAHREGFRGVRGSTSGAEDSAGFGDTLADDPCFPGSRGGLYEVSEGMRADTPDGFERDGFRATALDLL
jgi:hypothetical protein